MYLSTVSPLPPTVHSGDDGDTVDRYIPSPPGIVRQGANNT